MAIARLPKAKAETTTPPVVDESTVEALINKGGSSTLAKPAETNQDEDRIKTIPLRTYESHIREIDELLSGIPKRQRPSRNAYIVQAIEARLQRDKSKRK
ncbi:hypothetical protein [Spirosoma aerophilum]